MLQKAIISLFANRKNKDTKASFSGYDEVSNIGILINANHSDPIGLDQFVNKFDQDGKSTHVIGITSQKASKLKNVNSVLHKEDFGISGSAKSMAAVSFVERKYDYLILLDHEGDYLLEHLARQCSASYLIGFSDFPKSDMLTLQIKSEAPQELEDIYFYIKKISN